MGFIIIDAHSHLWLKQDTVVEELPIRTLENGRSLEKQPGIDSGIPEDT